MKTPTGPILGLSPLDKDATACLYAGGEWAAVAEERLSRVKLHAGFPHRAVAAVTEQAGVDPAAVRRVVYPFMPWWVEGAQISAGFLRDLPFTLANGTPSAAKRGHLKAYAGWCARAIADHRRFHRELRRGLASAGIDAPITRVDHHASHAAAAYLTSGFDRALAFTLDWYGGGLAGSVSRCTPDGIERLHQLRYPHSLGLFYSQVTTALGFQPSRHEGKVLGLAAYGDPRVLGPEVLERFDRGDGGFRYRSGMDPAYARDLAARHPREHVAAAYQHALEEVACRLAEHWLAATGEEHVVLAGGVAANVKLNQRIAALDGVRRVFVHPNMGDGGAGTGAVLAVLHEAGEVESSEWETCNLGPSFTDGQLADAVRAAGLQPTRPQDASRDVAQLLAEGNAVARFAGPMEYGPRALGNRSILCAAGDPRVNTWLNRRLGRTEFMPFAPVTLAEHARELYVGIDDVMAAARFMTITCDCTPRMRGEAPAAVHVDGTARPQILGREDNPGLRAILEAYRELTGIPTLINTSFNMHEEPIVCSPEDAVRAFLDGGLDYLAMGPFLIASESASRPCAQAVG